MSEFTVACPICGEVLGLCLSGERVPDAIHVCGAETDEHRRQSTRLKLAAAAAAWDLLMDLSAKREKGRPVEEPDGPVLRPTHRSDNKEDIPR